MAANGEQALPGIEPLEDPGLVPPSVGWPALVRWSSEAARWISQAVNAADPATPGSIQSPEHLHRAEALIRDWNRLLAEGD